MRKTCSKPGCMNFTTISKSKYCSISCATSHRMIGNTFLSGKKHSKETKEKIANKNLGSKRTQETKNNISKGLLGKKHSEERIEKLRKRNIGNKYGEGKKSWLNKKHSEETKKKISESNKGKIGAKFKHSEETKKRMRDIASKRIFTGSSMNNYFIVEGLKCQGKSEKKYIEELIKNGLNLPKRCTSYIKTPYGNRLLDFEYLDRFIEIKSKWTYSFYIGSDQEQKDIWISNNIKKVEIIII